MSGADTTWWAPESIRPALAAVVAGWLEGAPAAGRFPGGGRPARARGIPPSRRADDPHPAAFSHWYWG